MPELTPQDVERALKRALDEALAQYGDTVMAKAWNQFLVPFLPVVIAMNRAEELKAAADAHDVPLSAWNDAIALIGYLRHSDDQHSAWLASELARTHCQNPDKFFAAVMGTYRPAAPN